jgi:hypothetical protein
MSSKSGLEMSVAEKIQNKYFPSSKQGFVRGAEGNTFLFNHTFKTCMKKGDAIRSAKVSDCMSVFPDVP